MTSPLIVETGAVVPGANGYITVENANAYHAARRNTAWTGTVATKEGAIIRATDYMVQVYRQRWKGSRMDQTQALDWPRGYVDLEPFIKGALYPYGTFPYMVPNNIVPDLVQNACAELALRSLTGALWEDATPQVQSETVGPVSVTYAPYAQARARTFPAVDAMLAEFLKSLGGAMAKIERS